MTNIASDRLARLPAARAHAEWAQDEPSVGKQESLGSALPAVLGLAAGPGAGERNVRATRCLVRRHAGELLVSSGSVWSGEDRCKNPQRLR